jgi:RNA polymerase sigma-70 factor (ECF subfamily)
LDGRPVDLFEFTGFHDKAGDAPAIARSLTEQVATYFTNYRDPIFRYLQYGCRCSDAEELTQEVFLRLYRALHRGDRIQDVPRWLYTVARHLAIDRNRSRHVMHLIPVLEKVWRRLLDTVPDQSPTTEAVLIGQNRNDKFREALDCLTDTQRQCLQLRAEGLMYRQIADAMHMSVSGVADSVARAVTKLKTKLGDHAN